MNLYEYLKANNEDDIDTYDTAFDTSVCVCVDLNPIKPDNYDRFCLALIKRVKFVEAHNNSLTCDWYSLINDNLEVFKQITKDYWVTDYSYWVTDYSDKDDFIYEWIKELNSYLAGYVDEKFYGVLVKRLEQIPLAR